MRAGRRRGEGCVMNMIETCGLGKRFGARTAVADIIMIVPAGCAFGFLGHNGAGKTTVIRMLTGLIGRENLQVIAAARGPQARPRIEPALVRAGLADRAGDRVSSYSQGMRQRLGIARCLLADPQLVILDVSMNGLDPGGILELRGLIAELAAEGRTVFVSSHQLDEIEKTCQAAAVIDR